MYTFDAVKATNACIKWIKDWFRENGRDCNAVIGISGGKDSTVVAALCAKALGPKRVIGIMMPDGEQADISDSREIIRYLGIHGMEANIKDVTNAMLQMGNCLVGYAKEIGYEGVLTKQSRENMPPRVRMATLYLIAQSFNGRVSNNCNLSENWIGYSTIYGDTAGDFSPISNFTVSEVIEIGRVLGIPERFLVKAPSDGLCGKTDEEKIGFSYAVLDRYLRTGEIDDPEIKEIIDEMHKRNKFKHEPMKYFSWNESKVVAHGYLDTDRFGAVNGRTEEDLFAEGLKCYGTESKARELVAVWAHNKDEAADIVNGMSVTDFEAHAERFGHKVKKKKTFNLNK